MLEQASGFADEVKELAEAAESSVGSQSPLADAVAEASEPIEGLLGALEDFSTIPDAKLEELKALILEKLDHVESNGDTFIEEFQNQADRSLAQVGDAVDTVGTSVVTGMERLAALLEDLQLDKLLSNLEEKVDVVEGLLDELDGVLADAQQEIDGGFGRIMSTIEDINSQIETVRPVLENVRAIVAG